MTHLHFTKDKQVYFHNALAGTIEPMSSGAGKWAFIPNPDAHGMPDWLRKQIFRNTIRDIESWLKRLERR